MSPLPPATTAAPGLSRQSLGILALLASVFLFTLMDATGKHLTQQGYHAGQIVWCRMALNLALVALVLAPRLGQVARSASPLLRPSSRLQMSWDGKLALIRAVRSPSHQQEQSRKS